MGKCRRCETEIDDSCRFCPFCGAPQTEKAAKRLDQYVQRQIESEETDTDDGSSGGDNRRELWDRISYVVGYVTVVLGLTLRSNPEGWLFLLGGLVILPPTRRLLGRPFGRPFRREFVVGMYLLLTLAAVLLFQFL
jgi:hypothetical protein